MITYGILYRLLVVSIFVVPIITLFRHKANQIRISAAFLLALYFAFAAGFLFFPILYDAGMFKTGAPTVNLIPIRTLMDDFQHHSFEAAFKQVIGNVIVFLPFGFLIPILFSKFQHALKFAFLSLTFSVLIELIRFSISVFTHIPNHAADINDVLLNLAGGMLGYCLYVLLKVCRKRLVSVRQHHHEDVCS